MVRENTRTGFYQGAAYIDKGKIIVSECVPVALANYLVLKGFEKELISRIVQDLLNAPLYRGVTTGIENVWEVPQTIENTLRKNLGDGIDVVLESTISPDEIPPQYRSYTQYIPSGTPVQFEEKVPFIALTEHGIENVHVYVVLKDAGGVKRLDADGNRINGEMLH